MIFRAYPDTIKRRLIYPNKFILTYLYWRISSQDKYIYEDVVKNFHLQNMR